ncbi:MAG: secondary thiamine-phosphate synthase enzyme YjbQ [Parcubacteria group bacterium]
MKIHKQTIEKKSQSQIEFIDITHDVEDVLRESKVRNGQILVFSPHTTAGVAINQNESLLIQDFQRLLYKLVPIDERYSHDLFELKTGSKSDGRSNGHSHCKNMLVGVSEIIPVADGRMILGERQNIFLVELDGGRKRDVIVQIIGE